MKIGEALSLLKKENNRLARLIFLRKENVFAEKGKKSKFDPNKLSREISMKLELIRKLKIKIQKTNLITKLRGDSLSLAEAILRISDLRLEIDKLTNLFDKERGIFRSDDKKEMVTKMDELKVEDRIEQLGIEKAQLDNKVQITNWETDLSD